jgi:DNA-binding GntR family transcriptional regulator
VAFEAIKMAIITCEIAPGAELSEGLLAAQYNVGKAPIRNALSRLQQEGWVRSIPRQGHIVAPISLRDVGEIFNMREILEPEVTRAAAGNISPERVRELNADCQRYDGRSDARAKRALLLAHLRFHVEIAAATGNRRITRVLEQLHHESLRLFYLGIGSNSPDRDWRRGQDRLADALIEGDGDKAARLVREGIRRTRREVLEALAQAPPGLTDRGWTT